MTRALVGYTGFVGSNLAAGADFTRMYHSSNIAEAYGTAPDLLVYAGIRAEKYLANQDPEKDLQQIEEGFKNIQLISPRKLVLISTVDVYKNPVGVDEDTPINEQDLQPYGANRYRLEEKVRGTYTDALIVRLPGLFGKNLKKNFIFDFINVIPSMLKKEKFEELVMLNQELGAYYFPLNNGFYKCGDLSGPDRDRLKEIFRELRFSSLNFTDSRGIYQFYNLKHLWEHIQIALEKRLLLLNLATEPVGAGELYQCLTGESFENKILDAPPYYNYRTKYAELYGGDNGYIFGKETVINEIKEFVRESGWKA